MTDGEKRCAACGINKDASLYRFMFNNGRRYLRTCCRECENAERVEDRQRQRNATRDPHGDLRALFGIEREAWMEQAACRGIDTSRFFPARGESVQTIIRQTCDVCPVRGECLAYAEKTHSRWGIWGGLSDRSRQKLRVEAS